MKKYIAISCGAMIGAISRYAIALSLASLTPFFFTATLVVNLLGAFCIGFIFKKLVERNPLWHDFLITGLLGSFTTFSLLTYENYTLADTGDFLTLSIYLAINLFGGFMLAFLGMKSGGAS
ncbi:fluoride efflux transporter CrcB [Salinicoccus jeotgali]|uniref:Fluoride-specific ion channel FluC n=1 Tax=Salinicoccus jeotgali TaxID=381634 RepID=A0ABP7ESX3_9STAP